MNFENLRDLDCRWSDMKMWNFSVSSKKTIVWISEKFESNNFMPKIKENMTSWHVLENQYLIILMVCEHLWVWNV